MKSLLMLATGIVAGVSLVVACGKAGTRASAAPSDCAVWQYAVAEEVATVQVPVQNAVPARSFQANELPPGWEPIAGNAVYMRRCKP